jgi:hypothetical protein
VAGVVVDRKHRSRAVEGLRQRRRKVRLIGGLQRQLELVTPRQQPAGGKDLDVDLKRLTGRDGLLRGLGERMVGLRHQAIRVDGL